MEGRLDEVRTLRESVNLANNGLGRDHGREASTDYSAT